MKHILFPSRWTGNGFGAAALSLLLVLPLQAATLFVGEDDGNTAMHRWTIGGTDDVVGSEHAPFGGPWLFRPSGFAFSSVSMAALRLTMPPDAIAMDVRRMRGWFRTWPV